MVWQGTRGRNIMKNKLLVIDAMHLCYRNHFIHSHLKNNEGKSIGTIYGVINCIRSYQRKYKDYEIIFAWDNKPTVRKKIYPDYKVNRSNRPDWFFDFLDEVKKLKKIINALGIDQYDANKYEADDIAYYLCEKYKNAAYLTDSWKRKCILISGDSDWLQLINDKYNIKVYVPRNDRLYDERLFKSVYGLNDPIFITTFKCFKGDKSDNIKGIFRFPTKLAIYIANTYGYLSILFCKGLKDKNISERWRNEIIKNKDKLFLNEKLIRFCKLKVPIRKVIGRYDKSKLLNYYKKFEFKKFEKELLDLKNEY